MKKIIIIFSIITVITLSFNLYLDQTLNKANSIILNSDNKSELPDYIKDILVFNTNINSNKWYQNIETDIFAGNEIIYPGSEGEYKFTIKNDMSDMVNFSITLFESEHETSNIPLLYKIKEEDILVNNIWDNDLKEYTFILNPLEEKEYTLLWNWPFDLDNELDTKLGQSDNLIHKINFVIEVESVYEDS